MLFCKLSRNYLKLNLWHLHIGNEISSRHLAVCFLVSIDEDGLKLHLDPQELILNKGRSKSGRFFSLLELAGESDYEEWSKEILRYCFDIEISDNIQSSLFNL